MTRRPSDKRPVDLRKKVRPLGRLIVKPSPEASPPVSELESPKTKSTGGVSQAANGIAIAIAIAVRTRCENAPPQPMLLSLSCVVWCRWPLLLQFYFYSGIIILTLLASCFYHYTNLPCTVKRKAGIKIHYSLLDFFMRGKKLSTEKKKKDG